MEHSPETECQKAPPIVDETSAGGSPHVRPRIDSIDLLRGIVMVLMALDHTRDYFSTTLFQATNLAQTTVALFFTRWITHFCAPVFIFLAGTSAFLFASRGRTKTQLARFLLIRGLWLVFLELTVVRFAWVFHFKYRFILLQVIWVIGWSMVVMAGLVFLPRWTIAAFALTMMAAHNLLDGISLDHFRGPDGQLGWGGWLFIFLHIRHLPLFYPLIPWVGVMAAGFAFGPILFREPDERRRTFLYIGCALTAAFVILRALNLYGDPVPWSVQRSASFTFLSFLNTSKYPPSLLFLLMTLGPAIAALALFDKASGRLARFFIVFGRVPLFYYILHLYLIHALAVGVGALLGYEARAFFNLFFAFPRGYGFGLPVVYLVWIAVVLMLYPFCRWFVGVKQRRRDAWLSYL